MKIIKTQCSKYNTSFRYHKEVLYLLHCVLIICYRSCTNLTFSRSQTGLDWICSLDNHLWRAQKPWAVCWHKQTFLTQTFSHEKWLSTWAKILLFAELLCTNSGLTFVSSRLNPAAEVKICDGIISWNWF